VTRLILITISVLLSVVASPVARAADNPQFGPWMGIGVGAGVSDNFDVEDGSFSSSDHFAPTLKLEVFYTTLRLDYGLMIQHLAGGTYERPNGIEGRVGGIVYAGPFGRWRYWITEVGAFYLQAAPVWTGLLHSNYLRNDLAILRVVDAEDVEPVTHTVSLSTVVGFLWAIYDEIQLNLAFDALFVETRVAIGDGEMAYERTRGAATLSLVWTL
jgi:hypothetical protein